MTTGLEVGGWTGSAEFSGCESYRWWLSRRWGDGSGVVNFVMLNPSTADAQANDPTVRRCMGYARRWGFRELIVTNLYAIRSTDPSILKTHEEPIGVPLNFAALLSMAKHSDLVIAAWGNHADHAWAEVTYRAMSVVSDVACLRVSGTGAPGHPLYLPADLPPVRFPGYPEFTGALPPRTLADVWAILEAVRPLTGHPR